MALLALSAAAMLSASFPVWSEAPVRAQPGGERWTEALRIAESQPDTLLRSRARVEVLYAAGDLPGALREALAGLGEASQDPVLLRRASQLACALRITSVAADHAARLERTLAEHPAAPEQQAWWLAEAAEIERGVQELREHDRTLVAVTRRARWLSLGALGVILLGLFALARGR